MDIAPQQGVRFGINNRFTHEPVSPFFEINRPSEPGVLLRGYAANSQVEKEVFNVGRKKTTVEPTKTTRRKKALTPQARENQMISLAIDLAEKQLMEGTASSQVITHYLKLGSTKERIEKEILEKQKELISAKTENLQSAKRVEELYDNAIKAMRRYSGHGYGDEDV